MLDYQINVGQLVVGILGLLVTFFGGYQAIKNSIFTGVRLAMGSFIAFLVAILGLGGAAFHCNSTHNAQVGSYLTAACQTKNPSKARKYFGTILTHLKGTGKTDGFTSVLYQTPKDDIKEWYDCVAEAADEVDVDAGTLTVSPWRRKLIQSGIVKVDEKGEIEVTQPPGLGLAPYNAHFFWGFTGLIAGWGLSGLWWRRAVVKRRKTATNRLDEIPVAEIPVAHPI